MKTTYTQTTLHSTTDYLKQRIEALERENKRLQNLLKNKTSQGTIILN